VGESGKAEKEAAVRESDEVFTVLVPFFPS
jgi:hypothetical protein